MTATIKTWRPQGELTKNRVKTSMPMILQMALTVTTGTRPRSYAMTLQLFADYNFL